MPLLATQPTISPGRASNGATRAGSDTAGVISVALPAMPRAGDLATLTYGTPRDAAAPVVLSPLSPAAARIAWWARSVPGGFTVAAATAPPAALGRQVASFAYNAPVS